MKLNLKRNARVACVCGLLFAGVSCSDSTNDRTAIDEPAPENANMTVAQYELLEHYVNRIVVRTYSDMAERAVIMLDCINRLAGHNGTQAEQQALLDEACNAWRSTREAWEISEAFLFGTATESKIDPHMDSWPLDNNQLAGLLRSTTFSSIDDVEERASLLRDNYNNNLMGFHAAEYVMFADGAPKDLAVRPVTSEEMAYLQAAALVLAEDCIRLKSGWSGTEGLTVREHEIYSRIADDWGISANYGKYMLQAGKTGSLYVSFSHAVDQILEGCSTITNEVGTEKMENPIAKNSVLEVESWYSWNSIDDFQNNIRGVRYAYTGVYKETTGRSVQQLVQQQNPALDAKIISLIESSITYLENIRLQYGSYRQLIKEKGSDAKNDANVEGAQKCLKELTNALNQAKDLI